MQAVILAAGKGTRLGDLTKSLPKTLVELNGRPIIDYILSSLNPRVFSEVIIVGGYEFEILRGYIKKYGEGLKIRIVENKDYEKGSILTVQKAFPYFSDSFLLFNADHIYPKVVIENFANSSKDITCACDFDRNLTNDDMKIKLNEKKRVALIDKKLTDFDCGYVGMTFCSKEKLELYRNYAQRTLDEFGENSNVEKIIHKLADDKINPSTYDISGYGWLEIDNLEDLIKARKEIISNKYLNSL